MGPKKKLKGDSSSSSKSEAELKEELRGKIKKNGDLDKKLSVEIEKLTETIQKKTKQQEKVKEEGEALKLKYKEVTIIIFSTLFTYLLS